MATERENRPLVWPPKKTHTKPLTGAIWRVLILLGLSVSSAHRSLQSFIAAPMLKDERIFRVSARVLLSHFFWSYASSATLSGGWWIAFNVNWFSPAVSFCVCRHIGIGLVNEFFLLLAFRLLLGTANLLPILLLENHRPSLSRRASRHRQFGGFSGLALGPGFGMLAGGLLIVRFAGGAFFMCSVYRACPG